MGKDRRRASMVCFAVVANIVITSGHLETASIMMNIFPMKGPAKSTVVASMGRLAIPNDVRVQLQGKLVCLDKLYTTWPDLVKPMLPKAAPCDGFHPSCPRMILMEHF